MEEKLFDFWCSTSEQETGVKRLAILKEKQAARSTALKSLQGIIPNHYFPEGVIQKRLKRLGREKTAAMVKAILPKTTKAMSGDLGEILATEYVNQKLDFRVPILRLRWKDGRDLALRGDDVFAIKQTGNGNLHFLKGEVKSRRQLSPSTVAQAAKALQSNYGRPTAFVVNFVVNRLYEVGETSVAEALEDHLTSKHSPVTRLTHLLFTLSGNDSTTVLSTYLTGYSGKVRQIVVGVVIDDHPAFIHSAFGGVAGD